ncbi:MAG: carboxypeptidase-like regulatory domain-containing protein [Bryobacteraceae bacterium]|jgi:hypothetical protein
MRILAGLLLGRLSSPVFGQSLGSAGIIRGKVGDPSGAVIAGVRLRLLNDATMYRQEATTSASGELQFMNIPPNVYHLDVEAAGFQHQHRDLTVWSAVPVSLEISLAIEAQRTCEVRQSVAAGGSRERRDGGLGAGVREPGA